jgi:cysteine desulfurase/selenocysteine lyase
MIVAPPTLDVAALRRDFPILATRVHGDVPLVYFDNAATTQRPRQVIQSIVETSERHYANVHRGIHTLSEQSTEMFENAREKVRAFINAPAAEQVIFTHGTTESINLVARSWGDANLQAGDEILLTEMEHHANLVPWRQLAERTGAGIRYIPITDDGLLRLDELPRLISQRTKVVALSAVSNVLGTINPLEAVIAAAHAAGAVVLVDAAQAVPHLPLDVQVLDADFVAFSGHKMLGPSGVGILYGRRELLEAMPPFLGGGSMIRRVTLEGFEPAELPAKFEAGTPPIVAAIGLGVAVDYLRQVGLATIHEHERLLTERAHEVLESVGGVRILGPSLRGARGSRASDGTREPRVPHDKAGIVKAGIVKAGIVSFVLDGIHAHDVAQRLDRHGIAVRAGHHCAMPLHKRLGIAASARASFYLYNTLEEVDCLGEALTEVKRFFRRK